MQCTFVWCIHILHIWLLELLWSSFCTLQGLRQKNEGRVSERGESEDLLWMGKRRMRYQRLSGPFTEWRDSARRAPCCCLSFWLRGKSAAYVEERCRGTHKKRRAFTLFTWSLHLSSPQTFLCFLTSSSSWLLSTHMVMYHHTSDVLNTSSLSKTFVVFSLIHWYFNQSLGFVLQFYYSVLSVRHSFSWCTDQWHFFKALQRELLSVFAELKELFYR